MGTETATKHPAVSHRLWEWARTLPPGTRLPGVHLLASQFDANFKTVNKAVQTLVRQGALHRRKGQGTFVSPPNSRFGTAIGQVGLSFPTGSNPWYLDFMQDALCACQARNLALCPCAAMSSARVEQTFLEALSRQSGTLLLRFPNSLDTEQETCELAARLKLRTVMLNDFWHGGLGLPHVRVDEGLGMRLAVEHLLALGHRRIAFCEAGREVRTAALAAYRQTLKAAGIAPSRRSEILDDPEQFATRLLALRGNANAPTAAVFTFDLHAEDTIRQLQTQGVRIPQDLSVVGFDDASSAARAPVPLTTVRQPRVAMVNAALDLLLSDRCDTVVLAPERVVRKSTAPLR